LQHSVSKGATTRATATSTRAITARATAIAITKSIFEKYNIKES
jgi:hypothetical protein